MTGSLKNSSDGLCITNDTNGRLLVLVLDIDGKKWIRKVRRKAGAMTSFWLSDETKV